MNTPETSCFRLAVAGQKRGFVLLTNVKTEASHLPAIHGREKVFP